MKSLDEQKQLIREALALTTPDDQGRLTKVTLDKYGSLRRVPACVLGHIAAREGIPAYQMRVMGTPGLTEHLAVRHGYDRNLLSEVRNRFDLATIDPKREVEELLNLWGVA